MYGPTSAGGVVVCREVGELLIPLLGRYGLAVAALDWA